MTDRFDFEQQILKCWNVTEDIQEILNANDRGELTQDRLMNILIGVKTLYDMKFETLFSQFEELVAEKKL